MKSFIKTRSQLNEEIDSTELNIAEEILDQLVELVGSEEEVEEAAESAYNDLKSAHDADELEVYFDNEEPSYLALSSLLVKLVNTGKLDPKDADIFISKKQETIETEQ